MKRLLAIAFLGACTTSPQSLVVVHVDAEAGVQTASRSFTIRVEGRALGGDFVEEFSETYRQDGWGRNFMLGPRDHDASRSYRVTVIAFDDPNGAGTEVARNSLVSGYIAGQTRHYDLILYDACQGVVCREDERCDIAGLCIPVEVPPMTLPVFDAGGEDSGPEDDAGGDLDAGPVFDADPDFDGGPDDARPLIDGGPIDASLRDGALNDTSRPRDSGTPETGMPDVGRPDVGRPDVGGPDVGTDAGSDAGPPPNDAGMDSSMPRCPGLGMPCDTGEPCVQAAEITCQGTTDVCTPTVFAPAGTICGAPDFDMCLNAPRCTGSSRLCPSGASMCSAGQVCCTMGAGRCGSPPC